MEISETKKTNRYVALVTYLIAVICLLLGLFLPLFDGKGILALQLPDVINSIAGKDVLTFGKDFTLARPVTLFGNTDMIVDIMGWVVLLYAFVTVLSVIFLIPVIICTVKDKKAISVFAYIAETAAVLVLSIYLIIALTDYPFVAISYNMIIALGGTVLPLIVLSIANKKSTGVAKTFLFLLSAIGLIALFDLTTLIPALNDSFSSGKIGSALFGEPGDLSIGGINFQTLLFEYKYSETLKLIPEVKDKAAYVLATIAGLVVIINYLIDVVSLSSKGKRTGLLFNLGRYGLEIVTLICLIITVAVCKYNFGILMFVLAFVAVVQVLISVARFLMFRKRAAASMAVLMETPVTAEEQHEEQPAVSEEQPAAESFETQIPEPEPVLMEPHEVHTIEPERAEYKPEPEYNLNDFKPVQEVKPVQEIQEPKPVQPYVQPVVQQPAQTYNQPAQPVQPVVQQPAQTYVQPVQPVQPVVQQPAQTYVQPVQPVVQQPAIHQPAMNEPAVQTHVYTINTIYGGPTDEFMRKLTNEEKIEFAMTFIEKSRGVIGNIPDYVIGGNNRLFFSAVFIYLGRIRGMISDSLINKMYKELNMM